MTWIPYDTQLPDKPEISQLAKMLRITKAEAMLACLRTWTWAGEQTTDGVVNGLSPDDVDDVARTPGFGKALVKVGWLQGDSESIIFPNWDRWNGRPAKRRLQENERKRRERHA